MQFDALCIRIGTGLYLQCEIIWLLTFSPLLILLSLLSNNIVHYSKNNKKQRITFQYASCITDLTKYSIKSIITLKITENI